MQQNELYTVEYNPAVFRDVADIVSIFRSSGSIKGAERIQAKLNKAFDLLEMFPYAGTLLRDDDIAVMGIRMTVVEKYLVFYKVFEDEKKVVVYRILNGRNKYTAILNRMKHELDESE